MFSSSQFDGGFFASQSTQSPDSGPSPTKSRFSQKTLPVTVKQISQDSLSLDDKSIYQIDGVDVTNVKAQEKGVHRDEIARDLKLPVDKIMESIACLEGEGIVYSTIDEFHFKSTARLLGKTLALR